MKLTRRQTFAALTGAVLVVLMAAAIGLYAVARTDAGKKFVVQQIEAAVNDPTPAAPLLSIGKIKGNLLTDFRITVLRLSDADGEWMNAQNIAVSWSPWQLLVGDLVISSVDVENISVHRKPDYGPGAGDDDGGSFSMPPIEIALDKMHVRKIKLSEPVLGREMLLSVALDVNTDLDDLIHSELEITELESPGGQVKGTVDYHPYQRTLAIDVKLDEPEGGLIARALDLPGYPVISASIAGKGEINAWRGQMRVSAEDLFTSELSVSTLGESVIEMDIGGTAQFSKKYSADLPVIDDSLIGLDAALTLDLESGEIVLNSSRIENSVLALAGEGKMALEEGQFEIKVNTTTRDTGPLNELVAPLSFSEGTLDLKASGTIKKLALNAILLAKQVSLEDSLEARELTGTFSTMLDLSKLKSVPLKGSAALIGLSKLPEEALALTGSDLDLDFDVLYAFDSSYLRFDDFRIRSTHVNAAVSGGMTLPNGEAKLKISGELDDLAVFAPVSGKLRADIDLTATDMQKDLSGKADLKVINLDLKDDGLQKLVGSEVTVKSDLKLSGDHLSISNMTSDLSAGRISGTADFPVSFETVEAALTLALDDLSDFSALAGVGLAGGGKLTADLSGDIADPKVAGTLEVTSLAVSGSSLGRLVATYKITDMLSAPAGSLKGTLDHSRASANFATDFSLSDQAALALTNLSVSQGKNLVAGSLTIPFDGSPMIGEVKGQVPDLASLAALAGEEAKGSVKFTAALSDGKGDQVLALNLTGKNLNSASAGISITDLNITSATVGVFGSPEVRVTAIARDLMAQDFLLEQATVSGTGTLDRADFEFDVKGGPDFKLQLDGKGAFSFGPEKTRIDLSALTGRLEDKELKLSGPAALTMEGRTFSVETLSLAYGDGRLTGSARLDERRATAELEIVSLSLDILELVDPTLGLTGYIDGRATVEVTGNNTNTGKLRMTATNVRMEGENFTDLPDFSGEVTGTLKNSDLTFSTKVSGIEKTAMTAAGELPLVIALSPAAVDIAREKPITLDVNIDSDIRGLWDLLAIDTQKVTGLLTATARVRGSIDKPVIDGTASLKNGTFEDIEQGTSLSKLSLDASLEGTEQIKISLSAVDGEGGSVSSKGTINITDFDAPLLDISLKASNLIVLNRDDIELTTNADIGLTGTPSALLVKGDVTTEEVDVNIGGNLAPSVVDLKVEEKNRPDGKDKILEGSDFGADIKLNMLVTMPRRVFIRGRGLDSEWEGRFNVRGTAAKPIIDGYLKPVRGQFTFAGKSFRLQEGEISLLGGTNLDPELALSAIYEAKNVTAIVSIGGTASDPKISFTSPDGLPEDEVLSQILFGKSSGRLSALEAVQLAEALASLSGRFGGGRGITGFIRDTLGVDVINASTDSETGKAEVSVGKYVNDNVYIGVDQGAEAGSTRAKVQIDLTPNVTVETEMGQSSDSRVGIFWKWDY